MEKVYNVQVTDKQIDELLDVLYVDLDFSKRNLYSTKYGKKTIEGLREIVKNIMLRCDN
jgi:hypothetical protein